MQKQKEIEINFGGFYDTIHEAIIDIEIERHCEEEGIDIETYLEKTPAHYYDDNRNEYAKQWLKCLGNRIGIKFEFIEMNSWVGGGCIYAKSSDRKAKAKAIKFLKNEKMAFDLCHEVFEYANEFLLI